MAEKRPSDYRAQWDALKREAVILQGHTTGGLPARHPEVEAHEAAVAALNVGKDAVAHGAWFATPRDIADLTLLAEIVFDYHWDIATFPQLPADIEDRDDQELAVAYLVRGVLAVVGANVGAKQAAGGHAEKPAPGDRPRMPQLADKELDDLYAVADDAETAGRCLRATLSSVFHEYRLAAFRWDHARGLLSEEDLNGFPAETKRRREQARARARGQSVEARAGSVPASGNGEGRIVHELPGELEDLVGRARDGVTALHTLWGSHCISPEEFPDQKFAASLKFCIDGLDALLEKADQQIEAAIEARWRSPR